MHPARLPLLLLFRPLRWEFPRRQWRPRLRLRPKDLGPAQPSPKERRLQLLSTVSCDFYTPVLDLLSNML